jgi:hypothetical protein
MIRQYTTPVGPRCETLSAPQDEESGFSTRTETPATQSSEGNLHTSTNSRAVSRVATTAASPGSCLLLLLSTTGDRLAVIGHPERPAVDEILAEHWIVRSVRHITQVAGLFRVVVDSVASPEVESRSVRLGSRR